VRVRRSVRPQVHGREGASIRSLCLLLADGELRTGSRDENADLFRAVVGGYGNLGIVVEATYELLSLASPVQVETRFEKRLGVDGLAQRLRPGADPALACAVLALYGDTVRQLFATSRYTSGPWLRQVWLYRPVARRQTPASAQVTRLAGQACACRLADDLIDDNRPAWQLGLQVHPFAPVRTLDRLIGQNRQEGLRAFIGLYFH
jgi:hypothetical protein